MAAKKKRTPARKTKTKTTKKKTAKRKTATGKTSKAKTTKRATAKKKTTSKKTATAPTLKTIAIDVAKIWEVVQRLEAAVNRLNYPLEGAVQTQTQDTDPNVDLFNTGTTQEAATPANGEAHLTKEEVTQALETVGAKCGMDKVRDILTEFGASRISEVPAAQYPKFHAACTSAAQA